MTVRDAISDLPEKTSKNFLVDLKEPQSQLQRKYRWNYKNFRNTVTDHVVSELQPIVNCRISMIPKNTFEPDWRDLPNMHRTLSDGNVTYPLNYVKPKNGTKQKVVCNKIISKGSVSYFELLHSLESKASRK